MSKIMRQLQAEGRAAREAQAAKSTPAEEQGLSAAEAYAEYSRPLIRPVLCGHGLAGVCLRCLEKHTVIRGVFK